MRDFNNYPEGITEETIKESNRTISRTIIRKPATRMCFRKLYTDGWCVLL